MAEPAVVFEHVWKKFRRGERHDSFRDLVPALVRGLMRRSRRPELQDHEFWATRDVSFTVTPGEALGIIGPNGAGKSTILKLLTKILRPTRGVCDVRGRVGALIEVAAGFHPDLTGRENVYLQGAIMGMKRAEIAQKFDDIVDFSGVSEFIDTPVKRYSSGMNARLGFAIAAHLDPDVLLIDEVLSVGDASFQEQCVARMRSLIARGVPVVFISHNLPAIIELCTRAIVVERGQVRFDGTPAAAIQAYRQPSADAKQAPPPADAPVWITGGELVDARGESSAVFRTGEAMAIRLHYNTARRIPRPVFAVDIHRTDGVYCAGINTQMDGVGGGTVEGPGSVELSIRHLPLLPGCYSVSLGILDPAVMRPIDLRVHGYHFSVASERRDFGLVAIDRDWHSERLAPAAQSSPASPTPKMPALVRG
jgi:homopolymeric O-antigen transport system ATP-binding protein